jgi:hypothetical protein
VKGTERETARHGSAGGKFFRVFAGYAMAYYRASAGPPSGMGFRLAGAMAQQVAHLLCKQGVRGSSPLGSTQVGLVRGMFGHSGKSCGRATVSESFQDPPARAAPRALAAERAPSSVGLR